MAARLMQGKLEKSKEITWLEHSCTIRSAVKETDRAALAAMADELTR